MADHMEERLIDPNQTNDDDLFEAGLRPRVLDEYVAQGKAKENLRIFIQAARSRQ